MKDLNEFICASTDNDDAIIDAFVNEGFLGKLAQTIRSGAEKFNKAKTQVKTSINDFATFIKKAAEAQDIEDKQNLLKEAINSAYKVNKPLNAKIMGTYQFDKNEVLSITSTVLFGADVTDKNEIKNVDLTETTKTASDKNATKLAGDTTTAVLCMAAGRKIIDDLNKANSPYADKIDEFVSKLLKQN